jgi:hypothetical protein
MGALILFTFNHYSMVRKLIKLTVNDRPGVTTIVSKTSLRIKKRNEQTRTGFLQPCQFIYCF